MQFFWLKLTFASLIGMTWYHLTLAPNQALFFFIVTSIALLVAPYKLMLKEQKEEKIRTIYSSSNKYEMMRDYKNKEKALREERKREEKKRLKDELKRVKDRRIG